MISSLYAIVDAETLQSRGIELRAFAEELCAAGVRLVQYRDKKNGPREVLRAAREVAAVFEGTDARLILNDRADLAGLLRWGCHVGQGDLAVEDVRRVLVQAANGWVGLSTHNEAQVGEALKSSADYIAIGPVFGTTTKADADPVVGLEGVRMVRGLVDRPLVAIGGISHENARSVVEAGADSVAVISALLPRDGMSTRQRAEELIALLGG